MLSMKLPVSAEGAEGERSQRRPVHAAQPCVVLDTRQYLHADAVAAPGTRCRMKEYLCGLSHPNLSCWVWWVRHSYHRGGSPGGMCNGHPIDQAPMTATHARDPKSWPTLCVDEVWTLGRCANHAPHASAAHEVAYCRRYHVAISCDE